MTYGQRLIDANEAKAALLGWETDPTDEEIEHTIDHLPTADAVFVVRCGKCNFCETFYPEKQIGKEARQVWFCKLHRCNRKPDEFCSDGEAVIKERRSYQSVGAESMRKAVKK